MKRTNKISERLYNKHLPKPFIESTLECLVSLHIEQSHTSVTLFILCFCYLCSGTIFLLSSSFHWQHKVSWKWYTEEKRLRERIYYVISMNYGLKTDMNWKLVTSVCICICWAFVIILERYIHERNKTNWWAFGLNVQILVIWTHHTFLYLSLSLYRISFFSSLHLSITTD